MMRKILFAVVAVCLCASASAQEPIVLKGKELFGDMQARQIGPAVMSGRIIDLEGHPTNNRILYAGAAGGGVWKSVNGGATFNPIFDDYPQSIGSIAVDPTNPDEVVWVGTGEIWTRNSVSIGEGIYRSIDGGVTWQDKGLKDSERISSIEIHPEDGNTLYVGVLGALWGDSDARGVYKTTDGGETWQKILYVNPSTGCSDVIMDPNDPNTLYAAMWEFRRTGWSFSSGGPNSALYKSTDGGASWSKIHNGFPEGDLGRFAVAVAPGNSSVIYAAVEAENDEDKGLYRSNDSGASWEQLNKDFGLVVRPFYFSRLVVDPKDENVVLKAGLFGSMSRDGGKTFRDFPPGGMHPDIHDFLFDINDPDRLYAATDGGVYRSWDKGTTWDIVANMPVSQFYHISVDDAEPYNVYGGLQDNGSWYGPSASPGGIEARDWESIGMGDGFRVLKHPTKPYVYSEMQGAQSVWRIDLERKNFKTIQPLPVKGDPKLRFNWNAPMAVSAHQPDRFYMGSQFLHKSEDMGDSWVKISPDLTTNDPSKQDQASSGGLSTDNSGAENHTTIFTIAESPLNEQIIWVGTDDGNVQVTRDGGKNWTNTVANIPGLPANTWCYHIEASVHGEGTAYAVFDGHTQNDMNTYVYKTTDYGQSWVSIATADIAGFARNIQEDYVSEDLLFLGTEFGLYVTIDGGANWSKFTNNMPATAVHFIELQKRTNDLVMGTHGRGVIIIDDISPLRELTQEVLVKDVHFFASQPTVMSEQSDFFGFTNGLQYVGPNPTTDAKITYYLKKRHTFGKMTMDIYDQQGNHLIDLSPGKSKGINTVTWNYQVRQPKVAKGKTFTFGGFTSPRVPAGKYKVVMTKGKDTYEHEIELRYDPGSPLTMAERAEKNRITVKLYDMTEQLAYLVYQIDTEIENAETIAAQDAAGKKVAQPYIDELTRLKESLVITTGDNYVGSAEPQLREKLADLFSKVAASFDKPSPAEMENLELIEEGFVTGKNKFGTIKSKEGAKLEKYLNKNGIEPAKIKSMDEFIGG